MEERIGAVYEQCRLLAACGQCCSRCCQHQKRHQHQSVKGGACVHLIQIDDTCMPFRVGMEHIARRYSTEAKLSKTLPPRLPWGGGGPRIRCEVLTWRPSVPFFRQRCRLIHQKPGKS
ncbi:hypothetical protein CH063_11249 [Colletotrichum higginsianum]|uniref:Uncharacterized protein n=1 Tax=Colletotrichum higginsianum (strain IMI 349063) TaxID=759273 RepID=H1VKL5_COLHI|nr:hypothetical protein CH063_11249 [Colletotrichum higginsianum]